MSYIPFRYIEPFSRNYDFKKKLKKNVNLKYLRNLWINPFAQRTHLISIQNLPSERISKRLIQCYSSYRTIYKVTFFYKLFFFSKNIPLLKKWWAAMLKHLKAWFWLVDKKAREIYRVWVLKWNFILSYFIPRELNNHIEVITLNLVLALKKYINKLKVKRNKGSIHNLKNRKVRAKRVWILLVNKKI